MSAVPTPTPVTIPDSFTVKTLVFDDCHVAPLVMTCRLPSVSVAIDLIWLVSPTVSDRVDGTESRRIVDDDVDVEDGAVTAEPSHPEASTASKVRRTTASMTGRVVVM
jgi:hypothetical protein